MNLLARRNKVMSVKMHTQIVYVKTSDYFLVKLDYFFMLSLNDPDLSS